ncbi:MAG: glycosyltransferase family 9 protein [Raineya sp.]
MKKSYSKILVIQTAFIGDVILATAILEKLKSYYPEAKYSFLVRKGNESLFKNHPFLDEILVWDKTQSKYGNFLRILKHIRQNKFDLLINLHRFASSGFLMAFSGAKEKICFDKNPLSFLATHKQAHLLQKGIHEIDRNQSLIAHLTDPQAARPRLYPNVEDLESIKNFINGSYICIAPASVWHTKQFPQHKWIEFIRALPTNTKVYLLGAKTDFNLCQEILEASKPNNVSNLAGKISLLASAALMQKATMNYVNDSAPLHLASAMNAPVCAIYCSTTPDFGFYPLSDFAKIIESPEPLPCRPCGLHGYAQCPKGNFACAETIPTQILLEQLTQ